MAAIVISDSASAPNAFAARSNSLVTNCALFIALSCRRLRTSPRTTHTSGTMFVAFPPSMRPMLTVVSSINPSLKRDEKSAAAAMAWAPFLRLEARVGRPPADGHSEGHDAGRGVSRDRQGPQVEDIRLLGQDL